MENKITREELDVVRKSIFFATKKHFKNSHIQEDVASDCVIKVIEKLHLYDNSKAKLSTWVSRVANNYCIDILRKQTRERKFDSNIDISNLSIACDNENSFPNEDIKIVYSYVSRIFTGLKKSHIEVLLYCKQEGASYKEAAIKFNTSIENIRTIVSRVIKNIKIKTINDGKLELILTHLNY